MRDKLFNLAKIGVSLGLLLLLLWKVGWRETWETLSGSDFRYLLAAWGLYLFSMGLRAYRWQVLLFIQNLRAPLSKLISLYFIGTFFNTVLPTGIGGDVVRMYELSKYSSQGTESVSTVLVDRLCGWLVLFIMASVALIFSYRLVPPAVSAIIIVITLASIMAVWMALNETLWRWLQRLPLLSWFLKKKRVEEFYVSIQAYRTYAISRALLASLAFNILLMVMNYLIALALGIRISPWYFLVFIPIISFLLALPVSFSGLGVREGGYVLLFAQAGVPNSLALAMSLCVYGIMVATGLLGGLLYVLEGYRGLAEETSKEEDVDASRQP
jgi:uncharacterized protein (TIRG00374 family)